MSVYDRIRHRSAASVAEARATGRIDDLAGRRNCVLLTYKRNGEPVPTPVWFGVAEGKVYVRTEAGAWKLKRVRRDSRVRLAPSTLRGRPLGPPLEGTARVLDPQEFERAERAVAANYGPERAVYMRLFGEPAEEAAYIEVTPSGG